ncbi:MAG: hypothetical protein QE487_09165 [Fluviicola sp.]|nr:hypothetical protein [Fluviicola sp.]
MNKLTDTTKQTFYRFLNGDLPIKDFEQWVYTSSDNLEAELQPDFHLDLISFNYNQKDNFRQIGNKIKTHIDAKEFTIWRTKRLLNDIIENKIDLVLATRKLRELYLETGENFMPITLGVGYESVLDDVPTPAEYKQWESEALKHVLKKVDWYKDDIIRDTKQFLDTLNRMK